PNTYNVNITDINGCPETGGPFELTEPDRLFIDGVVTPVFIYGQNTGAIDISVLNAAGTPKYKWIGSGITPVTTTLEDQVNLISGYYSVTATDDNNCADDSTFFVNQPNDLTGGEIKVNTSTSEIVCNGSKPSTFKNITPANEGTLVYTYSWETSTTGNNPWFVIADSTRNECTWDSIIQQDFYVRRKVTDDAGDIAYSNILFLNYIQPYTVTIQNLDTAYCADASDLQISGLPSSANSYFESEANLSTFLGSLTTLSPTNTNDSIVPYDIKYVYVDNYGCKDSITESTYIRPYPDVTFILDKTVFSTTDNPYVLNGESPTGGVFSGPAVSPSNKTFYPSSLSPNTDTTIVYTYTNIYGCSNSKQQTVSIVSGYGTIKNIDLSPLLVKYCKTGSIDSVWIKAIPLNNMTSGIFSGYNKNTLEVISYTIDNLSNDSTGVIIVEKLSPGDYVIEFNYTGSQGDGIIKSEISVYDVRKKAEFIDFDTAYCNKKQIVTINAQSLQNGDLGEFDGFGITDNTDGSAIFNILDASSNPNPINIQYVYTHSESQCKDTLIQPVIINSLPPVSFDSKELFNKLEKPYEFKNLVPDNGKFSGNGTYKDSIVFNPQNASIGNNVVIYSYTDANQCENSDTAILIVENAKGTFDGINDFNIYCIDGVEDEIYYKSADPDKYYPVDFKVDDISIAENDTAMFLPSNWGAGKHELEFSYLGRDSLTLFWITEDISIDDIGTISINSGKTDFCVYDDTEPLIGMLNNIPANWGNFSGAGVPTDLNNDGLGTFIPSAANIGENFIYYTFASKKENSSCNKIDTVSFIVHNRPTIDFTLNQFYNINGDNDTIDTEPSGGYFTPVEYFDNDTVFAPSRTAVGDLILTYNYTDEYNCFNSLPKFATIEDSKGTIVGLEPNNIYCSDGIDDIISYQPADTDPFTPIVFKLGNDTLSVNTDTAVIRPYDFNAGIHELVFTYLARDNQTLFDITQQITIDKIGNLSISLPSDNYCAYVDDQIIIGNIDGTSANHGFFSGSGIFPTDDTDDGTATFSPQNANTGINTLIYTYESTLENSSCFKSTTLDVEIFQTATLSFELPQVYNINGPLDTLLATPKGGTYEPIDFIKQDTLFDPSLTTLGSLELSYIYENLSGCIDTIFAYSEIQQPSGVFLSIESVYCYNDAIDEISFTGISNPENRIGLFSGLGVSNNGNNSGSFNPKLAYDLTPNPTHDTIVEIEIIFTYTGIDDSTEFKRTQTTLVRNNGEITINNLNSEFTYCANGDPVELTALPAGGTFSGNGITTNIFDPSLVINNPDTSITYTYTDSEVGCAISKTIPINILSIPVLSINYPHQICSNDDPISIIGDPRNGSLKLLSFVSFDDNIDSIQFTPSNEYVGANKVYYRFTDPITQCQNTIDSILSIDTIPEIGISGLAADYCVDDDPISIHGTYKGAFTTHGIFLGEGIVNPTLNTGENEFNPQIVEAVKDTVYFTYTDNFGCTNTISQFVNIHALPEVYLFDTYDNGYCSSYNSEVTVSGNQPKSGSTFEINNTSLNQQNTYKFTPSVIYQDTSKLWLTYSYTDGNGCHNSIYDTITIWDLPNPRFNRPEICIAEPILFKYSEKTPLDKIKIFKWNFGDGNIEDSSTNIIHHEYFNSGEVTIILEVTDTNNCKNAYDTTIILEISPETNFSWSNECLNKAINLSYHGNSTIENYKFQWKFGDDTPISDGSDTIPETSHLYPSTGAYDIILTIDSRESTCLGSDTLTINVRPFIELSQLDDGYIQSFENGHDGWLPESLDTAKMYSWEFGKPQGSIINNAPDGEMIYVTNLNGYYASSENSAITSPCFDFSDIEKPMISLSAFLQLGENIDGAIIEYSLDDGANWQMVGNTDEGINWYNSDNINPDLGANNGRGWTGENTDWMVSKHDLNELRNKGNVRFRVRFASGDNTPGVEGFAFDNIKIGNRTRRVLVEHFTNSDYSSALQSDQIINNELIAWMPLDAIDIQYHTSTSINDPMYRNYPYGSSARESFYNIQSIPTTYYDGITSSNVLLNTPAKEREKLLSKALVDPIFNIHLNTEKTGNNLNIDIDLEALSDIDNRQLKLYTAVVEKSVTLNIESNELVFQNVLRNFLPNAGGEYINKQWDTGDLISYNYTYLKDNYVETIDSITVIAFVQDELNKEILQTATSDTTSIGTSAIEWLSNKLNSDFFMYPNPSNNLTNFIFSNTKKDIKLEILNQQGRVIHVANISSNQIEYQYNAQHLPQGIYFVRILNNDFQKSKKLVIYH
ncbi:MAG: T9SS type A sorting domain-containing protein, partial [Salinivirgaceae bacterium]|nr:T9SS type A sorting domain-containing protein [Salinivirgaceae bacterium]